MWFMSAVMWLIFRSDLAKKDLGQNTLDLQVHLDSNCLLEPINWEDGLTY